MTTYPINELPNAMLDALRAKEAEFESIQSWQGTAKLVASAALALLGIGGTIYSIYWTLVPWIYGVSIVAIGVGGASFQKFLVERTDGAKVVEQWRECHAAVQPGTPFHQLLESCANQTYSVEKVCQAYGQFKQARTYLN